MKAKTMKFGHRVGQNVEFCISKLTDDYSRQYHKRDLIADSNTVFKCITLLHSAEI